jgi:flagellar basal-body rod modification protein FlgD
MIEQMRQQDPLNPMDPSQMLAQLAQLNVVQQMIDLNTSFERFMTNQDLMQANGLMGRWVEGLDANLAFINGKVDWIEVIDGVVTLHIGDKLLLLNQVISVRNDAPPAEGGDNADSGTGGAGDGEDATGQAA